MKTGNTFASDGAGAPLWDASMEPGHEDREYVPKGAIPSARYMSLNGARS